MDTFPEIPQAVVLEHEIALMMSQQKVTGWPFDVKKAQQLENTLLTRLEHLRNESKK